MIYKISIPSFRLAMQHNPFCNLSRTVLKNIHRWCTYAMVTLNLSLIQWRFIEISSLGDLQNRYSIIQIGNATSPILRSRSNRCVKEYVYWWNILCKHEMCHYLVTFHRNQFTGWFIKSVVHLSNWQCNITHFAIYQTGVSKNMYTDEIYSAENEICHYLMTFHRNQFTGWFIKSVVHLSNWQCNITHFAIYQTGVSKKHTDEIYSAKMKCVTI